MKRGYFADDVSIIPNQSGLLGLRTVIEFYQRSVRAPAHIQRSVRPCPLRTRASLSATTAKASVTVICSALRKTVVTLTGCSSTAGSTRLFKGGSQIIDDLVADLHQQTGGKIDVLVLTHEHTDHISAFRESSNRFVNFKIDEVWMD
ncbi:MBL fold metallo-hydrolase [Pseudomonas sp. LB1P83]